MSQNLSLESIKIFENSEILVVNKPAGYETISNGTGKCLAAFIREVLNNKDIEPAHRLDRDTTGVQLFAKNTKTLKKLEDSFRQRKTRKQYMAVCSGIPRNSEGKISRNLSKWAGGRRPVQVIKGAGGLSAETSYQLLAINRDFPASLIMFTPHEGRTHQIRVHSEAFGRPILGDDQYGNRQENKKIKDTCGLSRQALHAWRLVIPCPWDDQAPLPLGFNAPMAPDMLAALDYLFANWQEIKRLGD